jgi:hypothetical protein
MSSLVTEIYRVLAKGTKLERLDDGDFISPQTPAMHPDGKHIFVPDYVRGIGVLEIATKRVRWLNVCKLTFAVLYQHSLKVSALPSGLGLRLDSCSAPLRQSEIKTDALRRR